MDPHRVKSPAWMNTSPGGTSIWQKDVLSVQNVRWIRKGHKSNLEVWGEAVSVFCILCSDKYLIPDTKYQMKIQKSINNHEVWGEAGSVFCILTNTKYLILESDNKYQMKIQKSIIYLEMWGEAVSVCHADKPQLVLLRWTRRWAHLRIKSVLINYSNSIQVTRRRANVQIKMYTLILVIFGKKDPSYACHIGLMC